MKILDQKALEMGLEFFVTEDDRDIKGEILGAMIKEDGSLISSYMRIISEDVYELCLKTKGSINSDQAKKATEYLYSDKVSDDFFDQVHLLTSSDWTVNMEWTSPDNRIVLPYWDDNLVVLNIRHNETGEYMIYDDIKSLYPAIWEKFVETEPAEIKQYMAECNTFDEVLAKVRAETGKEGYVWQLKDQMFKTKNDWYVSLHHSKDSITNPRRLFECVLDDATDDLRQMFSTDPIALKYINEAEEKYSAIYNRMVGEVELFAERYKHLERKDYAILGQEQIDNTLGAFSLAMMLYEDRSPDYKGHLKKQWKKLGLKDEKVLDEE